MEDSIWVGRRQWDGERCIDDHRRCSGQPQNRLMYRKPGQMPRRRGCSFLIHRHRNLRSLFGSPHSLPPLLESPSRMRLPIVSLLRSFCCTHLSPELAGGLFQRINNHLTTETPELIRTNPEKHDPDGLERDAHIHDPRVIAQVVDIQDTHLVEPEVAPSGYLPKTGKAW